MSHLPHTSIKLCSALLISIFTAKAAAVRSSNDLDTKEIGKATIDFIQISANPGIGGAIFNVKQDNRKSTMTLAQAGFGTDFPFANTYIDGYWGAAINGGAIIR